MSDEHTATKAQQAIETVRTAPWGSVDHGNAHAFLCHLLEDDLKQWIKDHPPTVLGPTSYAADDPHRAVMLYGDCLLPNFKNDVISDILYHSQSLFIQCAKKAIQSLKTKSRKGVHERITASFPEYPELLKQIRAAKRDWNIEDTVIKQTHSFRMMGGLARMGSRSGAKYSRLVEQAQKMEMAVLGKIVTSHTRANG
jgi:hypothetical protein